MSDASDKGRALELLLARELRRKGLDKGAKRMHRSGAIEHRKSDVFTALRYSFECKNQERVQLWEWWGQVSGQARMGLPPVLVVGGDFRPALAIVDLETLLNLMKVEQDYYEDIPDRPKLGQRARG